MTATPAFDQLPELAGLGVRHARDVLPPSEGTLAFISPGDVAAAAAGVEAGDTIPLNLALDAFDPPLFGRDRIGHQVVEAGRNELEDVLDRFNPQASSQLDGLGHVRAREHGWFAGGQDAEAARQACGIHHWATRGIAARGVLLDVQRHWRQTGRSSDPGDGTPITAGDLAEVAEAQQVALRPGDALLVRTGWVAHHLAAGQPQVRGWQGLSAEEQTARFLWDQRISLVGADNPAVEDAPGDRARGSLHRRLIPALGMPLMELLDLEHLSVRCRQRGRFDFLLVVVPLHITGGVSSPANAMALL